MLCCATAQAQKAPDGRQQGKPKLTVLDKLREPRPAKTTPQAARAMAAALKTSDGRELQGNLTYRSSWTEGNQAYGYYFFNAAQPITPQPLGLDANMNANGGGSVVDGKFNMMYFYKMYGYTFVTYRQYDTTTWQQTATAEPNDPTLVAMETATSKDGTVYGAFSSADETSYELGVIDYSTLTRTTIGTLQHDFCALGITSDGTIYGVASNGNLYKIDKTNAMESLVGSTGLTLATDLGIRVLQSGEIDQRTNTFYWAAIDAQGHSGLYTVDLTTGKAEKLADFPEQERVLAMSIPAYYAADGAPAIVTNLAADFREGQKTGTISFDAPNTTFGGSALEGELDYYILADNDTVAKGKATAGEKVQAQVTVEQDSTVTFAVAAGNAEGYGPETKVKQYIGFDTPKPVTNIKLDIDKQTGKANLTFDAPVEGVNGGYVGNLTYAITRYPEGKAVATANAANSFEETIGATDQTFYYYGVKATSHGKTGSEATSNKVLYGKGFETPYSQTFDTAESFGLFTVADANYDGFTWDYYEQQWGNSAVKYNSSPENAADDWLITPAIELKKGKLYTFSFKARANSSTYPERLEVKYGNDNSVEAMTNDVLEPTVLKGSEYRTFKKEIQPEEDTKVFFGFHALSDADMYYLVIDDISVDAGTATTAPDSVANLTVTPDAKGDNKAKIAFNAPTVNMAGSTLGQITKIEVVRNEADTVKTFESPKPGQALEYEDVLETAGTNAYTVVAYNADGKGRTSRSVAVFVGVDTPAQVEETDIKDKQTEVEISWTPVTKGVEGGFVDPDNLSYIIYNVTSGYETGNENEAIDTVKTSPYIIKGNTNEGDQKITMYAVAAVNKAGKSYPATYTPQLIVGKPYEMPYAESFANGQNATLWQMDDNGGWTEFAYDQSASADGDDGSVSLYSYDSADVATLSSGKISVSGAKSPKVRFAHKATPGANVRITVKAIRPDGQVDSLTTVDYKDIEGESEWRYSFAPLTKEHAALPYTRIVFEAQAESGEQLYIDDISLQDFLTADLGVQLQAGQSARRGQEATIKATVSNNGMSAEQGYTLTIKADGEEVETFDVEEPIEAGTDSTFTIAYTPSVFGSGDEAKITASVAVDGDEDPDNDNAEATISIKESNLPAPAAAKAETEGGEVKISWSVPSKLAPEQVTDDFEQYEAWTYDSFGQWEGFFGEKGQTGSIMSGGPIPNEDKQFAYIVFNPNDLGPSTTTNIPGLKPHSGNQYLASIYSTVDDNMISSDDWLVSPELDGGAQTISFWVSNLNSDTYQYQETFDVLYSTGGTEAADFVKIGDTHVAREGTWEQVTVELPEGAKHFAIHHNTPVEMATPFVLLIDDVTYTTNAAPATGYNIYRDGQLVGRVDAGQTEYTDAEGGDAHKYAVTATYEAGESMPTEATFTTGISQAEADKGEGTQDAYTIDGRHAGKYGKTAGKLPKGVYVVGGKKIVAK